jgi:N-acyl-D-amino-acid deacylase
MFMVNNLFKRSVFLGVLFVFVASVIVWINAPMAVSADDGRYKYDLLITNGRVIDPETGRDEVAAVVVKDGTIKIISPALDVESINAKRVIDASGLVVSPGFINTHTHEAIEVDTEANLSPTSMLMAHDGVTFWLGGNCGMSPTGISISSDEGISVIQGDHTKPLSKFLDEAENVPLYNNYGTMSGNLTLRSQMGLRHMENETPEQVEKMKKILAKDMAAGSFGISGGLMYDMGATTEAMTELARVSKEAGGMAALHTRYPTFNLKHLSLGMESVILKRSITEAINISRETGVPLIVSHITAMAQADSARWNFQVIDEAIREEGLPLAGDIIGDDYVSNDFYLLTFKAKIPVKVMLKLGNYNMDQFYAAHDVYVEGELFKPEFGQFTLEELEYLRKNIEKIDGFGEGRYTLRLLCKIVSKEDTILGLQQPWVFVGNDFGGRAMDPETGEFTPSSHRALATFSRLMGHWARDERAISLHQALFKATIAPAMWMGLDKKGRMQQGCDADIVIFNPDTIIDKADWMYHKENLKPEGISYVIVNGQVVVENNELTGLAPGSLVRRTWDIPGDTGAIIALYDKRFKS